MNKRTRGIVPPEWLAAVLDGTDPETARRRLDDDAAEQAALEDFVPEATEAAAIAQASEDYTHRNGPDTSRRDEIFRARPELKLIADCVQKRRRLDRELRALLCLFREWGDPPPSLTDLAIVAEMSPSGVRTGYTEDIREYITGILGVPPRESRDPAIPSIEVPNPFAPRLLLGQNVEGNVFLPEGATCLVDVALTDVDVNAVWGLFSVQILDQLVPGISPQGFFDEPTSIERVPAAIDPDARWNYTPADESESGDAGRSDTRLRLIASVGTGAGPIPAPDHGLILVGHVAPLISRMPDAYVLTPPQRAYQWRWSLTAPDGSVQPLRIARRPVIDLSAFTVTADRSTDLHLNLAQTVVRGQVQRALEYPL